MHGNKYCICIQISFDVLDDAENIGGTQMVLMDKYYKMLLF